MIKVTNLCKSINNKKILNDISFSLSGGNVLGIVGPNGTGKSTLISILCNIIKPTSGHISYYLNNVKYNGDIKKMIGYIPQELALYEELSIKDNFLLFGSSISNNKRVILDRCKSVAKDLALEDEFNTRVSKLSGGTKRRVNIGIGLIRDPKFIFMDEPVVGVDYIARREVEGIISRMSSEGKIIVITSHLMEFIENTCNKLLILKNGEQEYFGDFNDEARHKI